MAGVSRHDTGRKAFTLGWSQKALIALTVVYVLWSLSTMGVSAERLSAGWAQGARFIAQMFPPETGKMEELWQGIKETLQIAVLATVIGLLLFFDSLGINSGIEVLDMHMEKLMVYCAMVFAVVLELIQMRYSSNLAKWKEERRKEQLEGEQLKSEQANS